MELCGLPKARPIVCNDCPAFQRHHRSACCTAESLTRFPWAINTTFEEQIYTRWCCIDPLNAPYPVGHSVSTGVLRDVCRDNRRKALSSCAPNRCRADSWLLCDGPPSLPWNRTLDTASHLVPEPGFGVSCTLPGPV